MDANNFQRSTYKNNILPPLNVRLAVKRSKSWQKAVMDAFEYIGQEQFVENSVFWDYYRMYDGKMSIQELKHAVPHLQYLDDLLSDAGIPPFLKHYDILGAIIRDIVAKYVDLQDKFHVIDSGEVADNEYLRFKNDEINKQMKKIIDDDIAEYLAKNGFTMEGKKFASQEEQQAFLQQMEAAKQKGTPKHTKNKVDTPFKTVGVTWGEATMDKDKETMDMVGFEKENLVDKLLSGRCFREYVIGHDSYYLNNWSAKNTFFSKEVDGKLAQKMEYVGRLHVMTPTEVITKHGHRIKTNIQKQLLGGNVDWKNFVDNGQISGNINQALSSNLNKSEWVPFDGYHDYNFLLNIQDQFNVPMGEAVWFKDEEGGKQDRFLPRYHQQKYGFYTAYASAIRDDFKHRSDLCQVTEVYFQAQDLWGLLKYETESGLVVTEEVTEDILPDFLKENNIKSDFKSSIADVINNTQEIKEQELNTIVWLYRPVTYKGLKISSPNLEEDLIIYCEPTEYQIPGDSEFERLLPVAGFVGKAYAHKIMPYQSGFNLVMNQIYNLLEKEVGIFFLLDVSLIPSEIDGWGDAEDAMIEMRNLAKDIGILPVQTSGDSQKNQNNFNQFTTHNLTYAGQIQYRMALADKYKMLAYETLGTNPQANLQPTKYETAEGVRLNNEASSTQLAEIFQEFSEFNKGAWALHMNVAQYCQSNKKDLSVSYTKSDASKVFLQFNDPNFPLRRLGIVPSKDNQKRKELELSKNWLMNNNTVGSDELAFAELVSSDSMSTLIDVARRTVERRQEQEQLAHDRALELKDKEAAIAEQKDAKAFERVQWKTNEDNKAKVKVGELNAMGRAADKDAASSDMQAIADSANQDLKAREIDLKENIANKEIALKAEGQQSTQALAFQKLKLQAEELRSKMAMKNQDVSIAAMNKN